MDPILVFLLVIAVGIAAGIIAQRFARPSWLTRQIAGGRRAEVTSALVGIAGAFIGFHLVALFLLAAGLSGLFLGAAAGAALVLWGWREIRL